jgi:penicillin G amidase
MRTWLLRLALALPLLLTLALVAAWLLLRGSLAQLEGERELAGLSAPASASRDALGSVTVEAGNRLDAYRAQGFVHAQERYFEMDLTRRSAAGELAALVGPAALALDRERRVHRLRAHAEAEIAALDPASRAALDAYVAGVNAGLAALRVRPWPYLLLRSAPEPWRAEDSLLTVHAMFFDLQDSANRRELALHRLRRHLPGELVELLAVDGSDLDAPLLGEARETLDVSPVLARLAEAGDLAQAPPFEEPAMPGSNNFAAAGRLSPHGHAIVANDMHLGLRAPNIWFRARLRFADATAPGGLVDVSGLSLPGVPGIVAGSNGSVAWAFTNSYGDWFDWFRVEWEDREALRYRTPEGSRLAERFIERIDVRGAKAESLEVLWTRWGPVLHQEPDGSALALAWVAQRAGSVDFGLTGLEAAADLDSALSVASRAGMPHQNVLVGDSSGRIGWTLSGRIPQRVGDCDPKRPLDPLAGCDWQGWLPAEANPHLEDPEDGRLWTANSRVVEGEALALIGDGGYDLGARQGQIRDVMRGTPRFAESDLLALQLDDRALFMARWWQLLREVLTKATGLDELEAATRGWEGRAVPEAVSYRLARAFRSEVAKRVQEAILAPAREEEGGDFIAPRLTQFEAVLWPLVETRDNEPTVAALLRESARSVSESLGSQPGGLAVRTWGEANTARIRHPLAGALPDVLARHLQMPSEPLPGDSHLPRVQGPGFGASQRSVVAPGREAEGLLHMPGGQSGHPLSPFWAAGHADWAQGRASGFLPGPDAFHLQFLPRN